MYRRLKRRYDLKEVLRLLDVLGEVVCFLTEVIIMLVLK